jgi:hypothetical protein
MGIRHAVELRGTLALLELLRIAKLVQLGRGLGKVRQRFAQDEANH